MEEKGTVGGRKVNRRRRREEGEEEGHLLQKVQILTFIKFTKGEEGDEDDG